MLAEAIEVIRQLWTGDEVTLRGEHFTVENARLYDPPTQTIPIIVSAFAPHAAKMAAASGDGLWTGGDAEVIQAWTHAGGTGPVYSQISLCWGEDKDEAAELAHRVWPNSGVPGQLNQDLPTPTHFEQASSIVTKDMIKESIACGPDVGRIVTEVREAIHHGVDHVYLHQIGDDQEGFCKVWSDQIAPAVAG
jgi:G6PDH family F420-dependent oxidoreductase